MMAWPSTPACPVGPPRARVRLHVRLVLTAALLVLGAVVTRAGRQPSDLQPAEQSSATTPAPPVLAREEQERFLREARIVRSRSAPKGITGSRRVTLSDGVITHDAHVQTVDDSRREFMGARGTELNFRDSWRFNIAAYRLSVLLGLDMVPVSVERRYQQQPAAFTWWVDDVLMDEGTRLKRKVRVPDPLTWNRQMYVVRVFDQLIYNTDRNVGNLLITSDWRVWMIDHTRAFRRHTTLRSSGDLKGCDRRLLARLETLERRALERELSRWLELGELDALLARRDAIVAFFKSAPPQALYELAHGIVPP